MSSLNTENIEVAWIAAGAAIGGGLVSGLLSGAYQHLREWVQRPKITLDFSMDSSTNLVKSQGEDSNGVFDNRYVRVRVRNSGQLTATGCIVYLVAIEEVLSTGKTIPTLFLEAMELSWPLNQYGSRNIPNGADFYVDLVKLSSRDPHWNFGVQHLYSTQASLRQYSGTYRFSLVASADNARSAKLTVDIKYEKTVSSLRAY